MHTSSFINRGSLVVSCQAYPGEPMRNPHTMAQVAASVVTGGATAVRVQGPEDIRAVRNTVQVPIIGLWKDGKDGVFITPTVDHCRAVISAGADVLALDATTRPRPDGLNFAQTVAAIREQWDGSIMADCDDLESATIAAELGCEFIGTTLAGYTPARPTTAGPDLELISSIAERINRDTGQLLIAEGRIHTPQQAQAALRAGADAVVVGTAITHPSSITSWFREAVTTAHDPV